MTDLTDILTDPSDGEYIHIRKSDIGDPFVQTEDDIRARMEARIAEIFKDRDIKPDFREGSMLNTMLSPAAKELSFFYEEMAVLLSMGFLSTAVLGYLDAKGVELGVTRLPATPAVGTVRFLGDDPRINAIDPLLVTPTYIPPGTVVSTVATDPETIPQQFEIVADPTDTQGVDIEKHSIKATKKALALEDWGNGVVEPTYTVEALPISDPSGPQGLLTGITGNVMYKITYVTTIGMKTLGVLENDNYEEGFGETDASERSWILEDLIDSKVRIEVPVPPVSVALNAIHSINVYRALDDGGGFSEFKRVGSIDPTLIPREFWDIKDNVNFEVSEAYLQDTNTTGVIQIQAQSIDPSSDANIAVRTIEILEDTIDGITKVTNPFVFSQGLDKESDDDYRARLLATIKNVPGAGTVQDYIDWALETPGISGVRVIPEWEEMFGYPNGPGTVKVQVSGEDSAEVNSILIEKVRQHIAGDIAVINPYAYNGVGNIIDPGVAKMTGVAVIRGDGDILPGTYEYIYTYVNVGGGETEHSAIKPVELPDGDSDFLYPEVTVVLVAGADNAVELSNLTTGQEGSSVENVVYRRIYRRLQGQLDVNGEVDEKFYLVGLHFNTEPNPTEFVDIVDTPYSRYAPIVNSTSMFNGKAPIGAHITVESINEFAVTLEAHIVCDPGYTLSGVPAAINLNPLLDTSLATYFNSIPSGGRAYYTDILNAIHDVEPGVLDFYGVIVSAPGFDDMDGTGGSPRYWQLSAGTNIVFDGDGSVYIEETA